MKVGFLSLMLTVAGVVIPAAAQAVAEQYQLDIPRQQLDAALKDLAQQTGLQIARFSDTPGGSAFVGPVKGDMPVTDALRTLLAPGKLTYKIVNDHTIAVMTLSAAAAQTDSPTASGAPRSTDTAAGDSKQQEGKKSVGDSFRLAQGNQGVAQGSSTVGRDVQSTSGSSANSPGLTEIVVTAQKKLERLQDVPIPVTVVSAKSLTDANQVRLQDYYASVPGLNLAVNDAGLPQISIRGITSGGYTNPTVGITVDDVPFGSSLSRVVGEEIQDFDPSDLDHIEVLRGPQGTLYGATSLGGLLKFVTVDPSTDGFFGHVQAGASSIENAGNAGYDVRGAVNLPLSDAWAARASAFYRDEPGYINNPVLGLEGVNKAEAFGGHLSLLWKPSQDTSLKLSALVQHTAVFGSSEVDIQPGLGDLQQDNTPGSGRNDGTMQAYSAIYKQKIGSAELTSITGYSVERYTNTLDLTNYYNGLQPYVPGSTGFEEIYSPDTSKFTEELRLSLPIGQKVEWVLGTFYDHEKSDYVISIPGVIFSTGTPVGSLVAYDADPAARYSEYALFTDVTYHFTDRFDVQFGGRESHYTEALPGVTSTGVFGGPAGPYLSTNANAFTYLVTPRLKLSEDLMVYTRLASGYRPGGPQYDCLSGPPHPPSGPCPYAPDKTQNYEIGIKGNGFERLLSFDVSLYYINWNDIQLQLREPQDAGGGVYYGNGSRAKSQGVEISLESRPVQDLKLAAWIVVSDAQLTQSFPSSATVNGYPGDTLPFTTRFSGNFSVEKEFPFFATSKGFIGGTETYLDSRRGIFVTAPEQRQYYGGYATTDFRAGVRYDSWTWRLYANNAFNRRGLLGGGVGTLNEVAFDYIRPRTIGLNIEKNF